MWYCTEYYPNWRVISEGEEEFRVGSYGSHIWASSDRQAGRIAKERGMGERVVSTGFKKKPYLYASEVLRSRQHLREKFHALSYLSMIGMASGVLTAQEVVGDKGIIHELAHGNTGDLLRRVKEIEDRVPGYKARSARRKARKP